MTHYTEKNNPESRDENLNCVCELLLLVAKANVTSNVHCYLIHEK